MTWIAFAGDANATALAKRDGGGLTVGRPRRRNPEGSERATAMRRSIAACLLVAFATPLTASPPPPPPAWVMAAGDILSTPERGDDAKVAPLFADKVTVSQNGVVVARGKLAWLAWRTKEMGYQRRPIAFSEGWSRDGAGGGDLMVIDTFEDFDRSKDPPGLYADPRMRTRSTLYRFGSDHLIHDVDIQRVEGFVMTPR